MKIAIKCVIWLAVAGVGAWTYAVLALHRDERLNSVYLLLAALCTYAIGYRFYSKWIAARVLRGVEISAGVEGAPARRARRLCDAAWKLTSTH